MAGNVAGWARPAEAGGVRCELPAVQWLPALLPGWSHLGAHGTVTDPYPMPGPQQSLVGGSLGGAGWGVQRLGCRAVGDVQVCGLGSGVGGGKPFMPGTERAGAVSGARDPCRIPVHETPMWSAFRRASVLCAGGGAFFI